MKSFPGRAPALRESLAHWWMAVCLIALAWALPPKTALGDGAFSASNLGLWPVMDWQTQSSPVYAGFGRVEIYDDGLLLASGGFVKDGCFALGTVWDPKPGDARTLEIRIYDQSVASSFREAVRIGYGYFRGRVPVGLTAPPIGASAPPGPPEKLTALGSIALAREPLPDSVPSTPPFLDLAPLPQSALSRILDESANPFSRPNGHVQLVQMHRRFDLTEALDWVEVAPEYALLAEAAIASDGTFRFLQVPTAGLTFQRTGGDTGFAAEFSGVLLRAWDGSTGADFEHATVRGTTQVTLWSKGTTGWLDLDQHALGFRVPAPQLSMTRSAAATDGQFQFAENHLTLLDPSGLPFPQAHCRVEILGIHSETRLAAPALSADGLVTIPPITVPRSPAWEIGVVQLRAWDDRTGATFETATVRASVSESVRLGGDNLAIPTLTTRSLRLAPLPPPPVEKPVIRTTLRALSVWNTHQSATLEVGVAGNPLALQWQKADTNGVWTNLTENANTLGVSTTSLRLSNLSASQRGFYRLMASNEAGVAISSPTQVAVREPQTLSLVGLPAAAQSGSSVTIAATSSAGLPVSLSLEVGSARLELGTTLQLFSPGVVTIRATQAGSDRYQAATLVQSLQVVEGPQAVRLERVAQGFQLHFRGDSGRVHVVDVTPSVTAGWTEFTRAPGAGLDQDTVIPVTDDGERTRFLRVRTE